MKRSFWRNENSNFASDKKTIMIKVIVVIDAGNFKKQYKGEKINEL